MSLLEQKLFPCAWCGKEVAPAAYLTYDFDLASMTCNTCHERQVLRGKTCLGSYDASIECRTICIDNVRCKGFSTLMIKRTLTQEMRKAGMDFIIDQRIARSKKPPPKTPHPYPDRKDPRRIAFDMACAPDGLSHANLTSISKEFNFDRVALRKSLTIQHKNGWRWDLFQGTKDKDIVGDSYCVSNLRRI